MPDLTRPVAGVIAVLVRDRRVLLVRRRNPPDAGLWSYPGGKIERGETIMDAAMRELEEETGIIGRPRRLLPPLEILRHDGDGALLAHFILLPVLCDRAAGVARAGSDALDVAWFATDEMDQHASGLSPHVAELARYALDTDTAVPRAVSVRVGSRKRL